VDVVANIAQLCDPGRQAKALAPGQRIDGRNVNTALQLLKNPLILSHRVSSSDKHCGQNHSRQAHGCNHLEPGRVIILGRLFSAVVDGSGPEALPLIAVEVVMLAIVFLGYRTLP
jgi:hypothetical protein